MALTRMQKTQSLVRQREVIAIRVHQWLDEWEKVPWDSKHYRKKPEKDFYMFTLGAKELKALTGIQRRVAIGGKPRYEDLGIQRRHEKARSEEIGLFVQYGFPWSTLTERKRKSGSFENLRKPGWLPTSIVLNILKAGDERQGLKVDPADLVAISDQADGTSVITFPKAFKTPGWKPRRLNPIQVIDGQHRLWAFEDKGPGSDFQLPVVAFHGLDIAWEAYLFYTINIKPKRINQSLAYDLYPLLRTEEWLEAGEGHSIYRETRAQELTETLWSHPSSPWYHRINMLGEPGLPAMVSQAGWIRSLMATYVKREAMRGRVGGLFGARVERDVLPWNRAQQAAFLIIAGQELLHAIKESKQEWAMKLREEQSKEDLAFYGPCSLLSTDQGVRGFLYVTNDLCYVRAKELKLRELPREQEASATDQEEVTKALTSFRRHKPLDGFLEGIADSLSKYDWRTSSAEGLTENQQTQKAAFRGSGGYKMIRQQLLLHLASEKTEIGQAAKSVLSGLGYR